MKTLHSIQSIYFDDKIKFPGYCFRSSNLQCLIDVSEKKYWMKIINFIIFMNNSVQRGQNKNF